MSGFSPDWLRLREPLDTASRAADLVQHLPLSRSAVLQVVDLGTGTGANLRYLAPRLGGEQEWLLVDDDPAVLRALPEALGRWALDIGADVEQRADESIVRTAAFRCRARSQRSNLAAEIDALALSRDTLVTSSALLDLVSAAWLDKLTARCRAADAQMLFALTYDGRTTCSPPEPEDGLVTALVNEHQATDKGFGPALGPAAAAAAAQSLAAAGYEIEVRPSDWQVKPAEDRLQVALLDGWLAAALEIAPQRQASLQDWHRRRREHVERGRSTLSVGHADIAAWLPRQR